MTDMQRRVATSQGEQVRRELHRIMQACEMVKQAAQTQYAVIVDLIRVIQQEAGEEYRLMEDRRPRVSCRED